MDLPNIFVWARFLVHVPCSYNVLRNRKILAVVSAIPRQSLVSVRQLSLLRRNFDDSRPSAEEHPRWHNNWVQMPGYSVATCLAQWTARSHAARNTVRYCRNDSPLYYIMITVCTWFWTATNKIGKDVFCKLVSVSVCLIIFLSLMFLIVDCRVFLSIKDL